MPSTSRATGFSVGFVLFVATVILVGALFWVGTGGGFFADERHYHVQCPSTTGLTAGSPVYLQGIRVGNVTSIEFVDDLTIPEVRVTLSVEGRAAQTRIRNDSLVTLKNIGLLGDVTVHVTQGSLESGEMARGGELRYEEKSLVANIVGEELTGNATDVLRQLVKILTKIDKGEGALGKLLNQSELYDNLNLFTTTLNQLAVNVDRMTVEVNDVVGEVRGGRGALGKLIFDEEYEQRIGRALESSANLIASLDSLARKIDSGEGVLGRIVSDDEFADDIELLVKRLERGAGSGERILAMLERGDGSIGMLLHDPSIAASLRDVFLGVRELGYVQNLIRNAESKGREVSLRESRASFIARNEAERARILALYPGRTGELGSTVPATHRNDGTTTDDGATTDDDITRDGGDDEKDDRDAGGGKDGK